MGLVKCLVAVMQQVPPKHRLVEDQCVCVCVIHFSSHITFICVWELSAQPTTSF